MQRSDRSEDSVSAAGGIDCTHPWAADDAFSALDAAISAAIGCADATGAATAIATVAVIVAALIVVFMDTPCGWLDCPTHRNGTLGAVPAYRCTYGSLAVADRAPPDCTVGAHRDLTQC